VQDALEITDNGHKMVVFTQFRPVLHCYHARLQNAMPLVPQFLLHGGVPTDTRQDVVKAWAAVKGPAMLICMTQVAGIGLNMTAARHGQFIDKLFVPMLNQQAVDRLNRIGQDKTQSVQILDYQARDTVESRVESILKVKKNLFENIVEQKEFEKKLIRDMLAEMRAKAAA
jgi:SNF2 family DNA or RNA helicase